MAFGDILEKVKDIFTGGDQTETVPQPTEQDNGGILPASQDPYGDPADAPQNVGYGNVGNAGVYNNGEILPASQDPYGDPADDLSMSNGGEYGGDNILPASQDPLGDPADDRA